MIVKINVHNILTKKVTYLSFIHGVLGTILTGIKAQTTTESWVLPLFVLHLKIIKVITTQSDKIDIKHNCRVIFNLI
jgi:hypothetical protein